MIKEAPTWEPPGIWNDKDPKVKLISQRFERARLHLWDNQKVVALARDMGCTIWVMCAQAGAFTQVQDVERDLIRLVLDKNLIRKSWKNNLWPVYLTTEFQRMELALKAKDGGKATMLGTGDTTIIRMMRPENKEEAYG